MPTSPQDSQLEPLISALLAGEPAERALAREAIRTALRIGRDGFDRLEAKILSRSMREMADSFQIFSGHRDVRKVSLFGSAREPREGASYRLAHDFARSIVEHGWMLITGAGPGIMEAGNAGAGRENSFGVAIRLPFEPGVNPVVDGDPKVYEFRYFFTRKLAFVKEADALVFLPGGFGTLDECFETLTLVQTGKSDLQPIVMLEPEGSGYWTAWLDFIRQQLLERGYISESDLALIHISHDPDDATRHIQRFYHAFHSLRMVGELTVLRLTRSVPEPALAELGERYADILADGRIRSSGPLPEERNEPHLEALPRLQLRFDRHHYGRLRQLVDELNNLAEGDAVAVTSPEHIDSLEQE